MFDCTCVGTWMGPVWPGPERQKVISFLKPLLSSCGTPSVGSVGSLSLEPYLGILFFGPYLPWLFMSIFVSNRGMGCVGGAGNGGSQCKGHVLGKNIQPHRAPHCTLIFAVC